MSAAVVERPEFALSPRRSGGLESAPTQTPRRKGHLHLVAAPTHRPRIGSRELAAAGAAGGRGMRLTQRGRRAMATAVLAVLAGGAVAVHAWATPASGPDVVTVQQGQTLSQIAQAKLPSLPVQEAVVRIQLRNGLNSLQLQAGQHLVIPGQD